MKKHIPNFLTLMNLLCGCLAIGNAYENNLIQVAILIAGSLLFDFFDGMAARLLKVHSEIGKQLDSLADVVSFGVVPGIVAAKLMLNALESTDNHYNFIFAFVLLFIPYIIPLFSALRLAKFNIDTRQTDSFIGVPTPANAILWVSLPLILEHDKYNLSFIILNPIILVILILLTSYLLVAEIPLFALKFKNLKWSENKVRFIFIILSVILIPVFMFAAIPLIIFLYVVLSLLNNMKLIK